MLRKRMYREAGSVAALITRSGLMTDQREITFPIMTLAQMGRTLDSRVSDGFTRPSGTSSEPCRWRDGARIPQRFF
jgi:hypothetical protein